MQDNSSSQRIEKYKMTQRLILSISLLLIWILIGCSNNVPTPLHYAVQDGDLHMARKLISKGADVNATCNSNTPLHYAMIYAIHKDGDNLPYKNGCDVSKMIGLLLSHGADINARGFQGYTPLHYAAMCKCGSAAKMLLDAGAALEIRDQSGCTPLHIAAERGSVLSAQLLISRGVNVNVRDNVDQTPLHYALRSTKMIKLLLDSGAKIDAKDHLGRTPLHQVSNRQYASLQDLNAAKLLIDQGANINARANDGNTPLLLSLRFIDDIKGGVISALLISLGANTKIVNKRSVSPADRANYYGYKELAELLRANSVPSKRRIFSVMLRCLLQVNRLEQVTLLLSQGADANDKNKLGNTALHIAAGLCDGGIVKALLQTKADVNMRNKFGETPLFQCIYPRDSRGVRRETRGYCAALYVQCEKPEESAFDVLVNSGADINARNKDGQTPLHMAVRRGTDISLIQLKSLVAHGANVSIKDNLGKIPSDYIHGYNREDRAETIRSLRMHP